MKIYIDESGLFIPSASSKGTYSAVGCLITPSIYQHKLKAAFLDFCISEGLDAISCKGSQLSEKQIAVLMDILGSFPILLNAVVVDCYQEKEQAIKKHQELQVIGTRGNITDDFHPSIIKEADELCDRLRKMPPQLYMQSVVMHEAIYDSIQKSLLYYPSLLPKELGSFEWIVDAKHNQNITNYEAYWRGTIAPMLQGKTLRKTFKTVIGHNYKYFNRKYTAKNPSKFHKSLRKNKNSQILDVVKIASVVSFETDESSVGLKLADIATNSLTRALKGHFSKDTLIKIAKLMPYKRNDVPKFISLSIAEKEKVGEYSKVIEVFHRHSKRIV